jgi:hypothetical protein
MYFKIIKWLIDDKNIPFANIRLLGKNIINWLIEHRIVLRFYNKLLQSGQTNLLPLELRNDLIKYCETVKETCNTQLTILQDITNLVSKETPPLFIKGLTAAILTENEKILRYSADIDLFTSDIDAIHSELAKYCLETKNITPAEHEYSFFKKDNVFIELHIGFPVLTISNIDEILFQSHKQTNIEPIKSSLITYNDLFENSIIISNKLTNNIAMRVLSYEYAALVLCLHIFKDSLWEPYKKPLFKICELLEFYDLITYHTFDIVIFINIVKRYNAEQAVSYTLNFLKAFVHIEDVLMDQLSCIEMPLIMKLMNASFGPYKLLDKNSYYNILFQSFNERINELGYIEVKSNDSIYNSKDIMQTYYASTDDSILDFQFSIDINIRIMIIINREIREGDNIFVKYSNGFSHIWFDQIGKPPRIYGHNTIAYQYYQSKSKIEITFPDNLLESSKLIIAFGNKSEINQKVTIVPIALVY